MVNMTELYCYVSDHLHTCTIIQICMTCTQGVTYLDCLSHLVCILLVYFLQEFHVLFGQGWMIFGKQRKSGG